MLESLFVEQVTFVEGELAPGDLLDALQWRRVPLPPRHRVDEVVQRDDVVARLQQLHGAVAADVARSARYQHRRPDAWHRHPRYCCKSPQVTCNIRTPSDMGRARERDNPGKHFKMLASWSAGSGFKSRQSRVNISCHRACSESCWGRRRMISSIAKAQFLIIFFNVIFWSTCNCCATLMPLKCLFLPLVWTTKPHLSDTWALEIYAREGQVSHIIYDAAAPNGDHVVDYIFTNCPNNPLPFLDPSLLSA